MDLRNLNTFRVFADNLNMTKTAEILGYTQPTITQQIKNLEDSIDQRLFYRSGNKLYLTKTGERLKQRSEQLFLLINEIEKDIKEQSNQTMEVTIAAPESFCSHFLSYIVREHFLDKSNLKLKIEAYPNRMITEKVKNGVVDIGMMFDYADENDHLVNIRLYPEDFVLVCSHEVFYKYDGDKEAVIKNSPLISYTKNHNERLLILQNKYIKELKLTFSEVISLGSEETIKRAVLDGVGIAFLPYLPIKSELFNEQYIALKNFPKSLYSSILIRKDVFENEKYEELTERIREIWKEVL